MKRAPVGTARGCAGFPSPAEQYQETPLDLNELLVKRPAATFFVKVQGDSMIGEGIRDGDLLVVDRSLRPASGDVIIACVDGDFTVKTLRWVGIPCGVGFAPTKTLAKIANHIGKKQPGGVFLLPDDPTEILASLPAGEVWGVGRRLALKLRAERIFSAKDLRDASDDVIRSVGGVVLLRTATELRGKPCNEERDYDADPDSDSCSRSFGEPVTTLDGISESLASFTAQARCSPLPKA